MKKILLLLTASLFLIISGKATAQCTPGNYSQPGIYPDTTVGLPDAAATQAYNATITVVVPKDTTITIMGTTQTVQVDSIGITAVNGLPSGFQYLPNSASGYWRGDSTGCVLITGTPSNGDEGTYPLSVNVMFYAGGFSAPYTVNGYELVVLDDSHVGINNNNSFNEVMAYPNPFSSELSIEFTMNIFAAVDVQLYNMVGAVVKQKSFNAVAGENIVTFNTSNLPEGVYFYRLNAGDRVITKKLVKK